MPFLNLKRPIVGKPEPIHFTTNATSGRLLAEPAVGWMRDWLYDLCSIRR